MNNFFDIFNADQVTTEYIRNLSFVSLLMSGAFVNIVRITDPYVRSNVILVFSKMIRCNFKITKEDESQYSIDAWNTSLNDVVVQFQNESIIQNIVFSVEEVSRVKDEEELIGSTVKMNKQELDLLLNGSEKSKLEKAVKLKKVIETQCVEDEEHNLSTFRNTMINYSIAAKQSLLKDNYNFKIKATALAYYVFERIRLMDGLTNERLSYSLNL